MPLRRPCSSGVAAPSSASLTLAARCGSAPGPPPTGKLALNDLRRLRRSSAASAGASAASPAAP
eukprot:6361947-Lingulodinium_polyedra.AAC.1